MNYFLDTEFIEKPGHLDLISIGIVTDDEREYYAVNRECDWEQANPWVRKNVFPHLPWNDGKAPWRSRADIKSELLAFVQVPCQFWGYYADFDWVVLCWLFGPMVDLPKGWPMFCMDLKQLSVSLGDLPLPQQGLEHHALADARWNRAAHTYLIDLQKGLTR